MPKTKDLAVLLRRRLEKDADLAKLVENEALNADIAEEILEARIAAGLTQRELADRVGTSQPVIARLEDADYDGHSLSMLKRIAEALGRRIRVEFCDPAAYSCSTAWPEASQESPHWIPREVMDWNPVVKVATELEATDKTAAH